MILWCYLEMHPTPRTTSLQTAELPSFIRIQCSDNHSTLHSSEGRAMNKESLAHNSWSYNLEIRTKK